MSEGQAWLGRSRPVNDTAVARAYWCTDTDISKLMYDYAPRAHRAYFYKIPGPAVLDLKCIDCGKAHIATSRGDAQTCLSYWHTRNHRCATCRMAHNIQKFRDEADKRNEKHLRDEELRWMPYRDYLSTDEWSERRKSVIKRAGFRCQICAAEGRLHVHHRTYARRGIERVEDMVALCAGCHELFHSHGKLAENGRAA